MKREVYFAIAEYRFVEVFHDLCLYSYRHCHVL